MKIALFASGEFAVPLALHLMEKNILALLFTKTDKPKGRGMKLKPTPVAEVVSGKVDVIKADKLTKSIYQEYIEKGIDIAIVIDYGIYIPSYFYKENAPFMVNIHPSLLPRWRGPAPIQWTIYSGDLYTGITFHQLSKEIDAGDILYQVKYELTGRETTTQLEAMLSEKVPVVWEEFMSLYVEGKIKAMPQGKDYTYAPMFDKDMMHIDFSKPCQEIDRLVRALADVPGAYAMFRNKRVKILYGECEGGSYKEYGKVVYVNREKLAISTGAGFYIPTKVKPEGKRAMPISAFIAGYKPEVGESWY